MSKIVLVDIDGTLADNSHRLHYIQGEHKNWDAYHLACLDDKPIRHVINLVGALCQRPYVPPEHDDLAEYAESDYSHEIWLTTGRSSIARSHTKNWLHQYGIYSRVLIMRDPKDHTPDHKLKIKWLTDGTIPRDQVAFAIEDRTRVVKAYRQAGIPCLQVADGDF